MADVREKIQNNLANAHRQLAAITQAQKEELKNSKHILKQYEALYDKEMKVLNTLQYDTKERGEQQERIDDLSRKITLTEETIAQYEMNLRELKAI